MPELMEAKLVLLCPDSGFAEQVAEAIGTSHIQFWLAQSPDHYEQLLQAIVPDVLLATDDTEWANAIFGAVRNRPPYPLTILLSDHPPLYTPSPLVDMWLPYSTLPSLPIHLNNALAWRQQLYEQRERCTQAEADRERLENEFQIQQQSSFQMLEQIKNAVVYNVTHELRTPLLQVKSAIALLEDDVGAEHSVLKLATGAVARLETGIHNLSALNSLIQNGLDREAFMLTEISEIIESAQLTIKRTWANKGHLERVKIKCDPSLKPIPCDSKRLSLALGLILDNAIKFSNKRIDFQATPVPGGVRFSVKDQGIGIPANQIEQIFDIFFQVDASATRRYNGMGIGLSIARHIVESHNSAIHVTSVENKGTTFWFDLHYDS